MGDVKMKVEKFLNVAPNISFHLEKEIQSFGIK